MALFQNISLRQLSFGAAATFLKYPLVLLSAITGTIAAVVRIEISYRNQHLYPYLDKLILVGALGLILFFVLELVARKYKFTLQKRFILWVGGLALLSAYFVLLPQQIEERQVLRFLMLALALHLGASYAMYANRREENAFWQFNESLFLRILTSGLYAAVLYIGLVIAVAAIDKLFVVNVPDNFYAQLWVCMVGIFNTWFFLAGVPTNVSELEARDTYPEGLKIFTQFVLLPLVTLYLLILYVYFGKIVGEWEWPEGWVSVLVLCFSIAGILSLLLIHPIRFEPGNSWMRTFARWFYRALFPLIILLLLAIWRRVSEYGITEPRYVVLVLALWLFCTALYFLLSRQKNIKFIPVTLSIVAVLATFGPFNAFQLSAWSQTNRLEHLLQKNGVLQNGRVTTSHPEVKEEVAQEVSSIVRYLAQMHDLRDLQPWFEPNLDTTLAPKPDSVGNYWNQTEEQAKAVVALMGMPYSVKYSGADEAGILNFTSITSEQNPTAVFNIKGYEYSILLNLFQGKDANSSQTYTLEGVPLTAWLDAQRSRLYVQAEDDTLQLNLLPYIKQLEKKQGQPLTQAELTFKAESSQLAIKLILQDFSVNKKAGYRLDNLHGYLLVKRKE